MVSHDGDCVRISTPGWGIRVAVRCGIHTRRLTIGASHPPQVSASATAATKEDYKLFRSYTEHLAKSHEDGSKIYENVLFEHFMGTLKDHDIKKSDSPVSLDELKDMLTYEDIKGY